MGLADFAFDTLRGQAERQTGCSLCYVLDANFQTLHALAHYQRHADVGGLNDTVHRRGEDKVAQLLDPSLVATNFPWEGKDH